MLEVCFINFVILRYYLWFYFIFLKYFGFVFIIIDRKFLFRLIGVLKDCVLGCLVVYCRFVFCILNDDWVSLWLVFNGGKKFCFDEFV